MSYKVIWSPKVKKRLKKLEESIKISIVKKILGISENPIPHLKLLKEIKVWCLRVGDYRIFIDIDENQKEMNILTVGHRREIYR